MRLYHHINLLSLDVALGAVASAALFGRILHVALLPQGFLLLGLIVWLIYTADHLLDAWSMKETAISERHRFHQQHFLTIALIFLAAGIVAIGLVFLIRIQVITAGIVFGVFVITYLLVNRYLKYFKEVAGSLLYTGGVMLPAWSINSQPITREQFLLISIFTLIVFTNMLIFARFSIEEDQVNDQKSLATALGVRFMNNLIRIVMLMCFLVMIYAAVDGITPELILFLVMEAVLLMIFEVKYFRINDRYRIYGDAIFLLPVLILFI